MLCTEDFVDLAMIATKRWDSWLSEDSRRVHMRCGGWEGSFPVEDLDGWLAFYRNLRGRKGRKYAAIYAPAVEALERVRRELWRTSDLHS